MLSEKVMHFFGRGSDDVLKGGCSVRSFPGEAMQRREGIKSRKEGPLCLCPRFGRRAVMGGRGKEKEKSGEKLSER